jgi:hypothetical protein
VTPCYKAIQEIRNRGQGKNQSCQEAGSFARKEQEAHDQRDTPDPEKAQGIREIKDAFFSLLSHVFIRIPLWRYCGRA